jgi:acetyl-CoA synthetase
VKAHVAKKIGPSARPDEILFTAELPKTRSGKIMRRLLRDIADGRASVLSRNCTSKNSSKT